MNSLTSQTPSLTSRQLKIYIRYLPVNQLKMDPSGPAQPPKNTAYTTPANPASSTPSEVQQQQRQGAHGNNNPSPTDERMPPSSSRVGGGSSSIDEATPSSLGYGIHGAPAGEERFGRTAAVVEQEEQGGHRGELDGEQMRASGEGDVASVVRRKPGATGEQPDLASDLDR